MQALQNILFKTVQLHGFKNIRPIRLFQNRSKPYFPSRLYYFSTENKQQQQEEEKQQETKVEEKGSVIKEVAKDVFYTIKDSTVEKAAGLKESFQKGFKEFSGETEGEKVSGVNRAVNIMKNAWRKTFPSEDEIVRERMEKIKAKVAEQKKIEEEQKEYSEEELANLQGQIPEWKRTAVQTCGEGVQEKASRKDQLISKISSRLSKTEFAQKMSETEEYKEFQTFKSEMRQFKEDVKDRVQNHPSNTVQASIWVYKSVTAENEVAKAIKGMRMIDPEFDLFQLEQEAKVIFENIYTQFLLGDLPQLEKVCGEMALGYFKVLLKKREAEKSEPKYKYLWNVEPAFFQKAFVPDTTKLPVFVFNIKAQEVYCYVSKTDPKKIIDGDDERVMSMDYIFALTPHLSPCLETVGHSWEMIELQPREVVKMLV